MPATGLGTFGCDRVSREEVAEAVEGAAVVGYRHFDCASLYGHEGGIGGASREIMSRIRGAKEERRINSSEGSSDGFGPVRGPLRVS
jgi:alcohol dehydrogenase (NADP+)